MLQSECTLSVFGGPAAPAPTEGLGWMVSPSKIPTYVQECFTHGP